MISLVREFTFDSAHHLEWHEGKCRNLHGHTYRLQVFITGKLNKKGILMDLKEIEGIVNKEAISILDHQCLNDYVPNPTVENVIIWIWGRLRKKLKGLYELRLWETPKSFAIYTG
ncbi:MAG: 6-carboxytetrahydropterin synthase [Candidatus Pacearchaeota archaeon]